MRIEALKFALSANATLGRRRTNEDKRRCAKIALEEFPKLSSRAIADLCGVSHTFIEQIRPLATVAGATVLTSDGRQHPAHPNNSKKERQEEEDRQDIEDAERILSDPDDKAAVNPLSSPQPSDLTRQDAPGLILRAWVIPQHGSFRPSPVP